MYPTTWTFNRSQNKALACLAFVQICLPVFWPSPFYPAALPVFLIPSLVVLIIYFTLEWTFISLKLIQYYLEQIKNDDHKRPSHIDKITAAAAWFFVVLGTVVIKCVQSNRNDSSNSMTGVTVSLIFSCVGIFVLVLDLIHQIQMFDLPQNIVLFSFCNLMVCLTWVVTPDNFSLCLMASIFSGFGFVLATWWTWRSRGHALDVETTTMCGLDFLLSVSTWSAYLAGAQNAVAINQIGMRIVCFVATTLFSATLVASATTQLMFWLRPRF
jgi:hypothetical protein